MSNCARVVYGEENVREPRWIDPGSEWGNCVEVVVRGRVGIGCREFGVEEGVENECLGCVVFAEVFRDNGKVVWHVAGIVNDL